MTISINAPLQSLVSSRHLIRALQLTPLAIALMMSSCTSTSRSGHSSVKAVSALASPTSNWCLVKSNPPTYYPKGFPAGSPTTHEDGDWIYAGANGEQWFVPKNGVRGFTPEQLHKEAFSRLTDEQHKAASADLKLTDIVLAAAGITVGSAIYVPIIMASGADPTGSTAKHVVESLGLE